MEKKEGECLLLERACEYYGAVSFIIYRISHISRSILQPTPKSIRALVLKMKFEAFCKAHGMSKVGATEQAIRQYMGKTNKALKNMK